MEDQIFMAERAKQILDEGVFDAFIESMQNDLALKIIHSLPDLKEQREEWYQLNRALNSLKGKLQEYANEFDKSQETE